MLDPHTVTVREAEPDDLPEVARLLSQLHPDVPALDPGSPPVRHAWQAVVAAPGRRLLVATIGTAVVGTVDAIVVVNLTHDGRPFVIVENFVVDAPRRRTGVGTVLMNEVIKRAVEAGCYKVQLMSERSRQEAHAFYERAGFAASAQGYRRYLR